MDVQFTPDQQAKLTRMAEARRRTPEALVKEAVERLLGFEEWFSSEVQKGLDTADRGELVEHAEVRQMIERW